MRWSRVVWLVGFSDWPASSDTDVRFSISDPGGAVDIHLLLQYKSWGFATASPLPEPDQLTTFFGKEMSPPSNYPCNMVGYPPCPLGTAGGQTFARGEFNFTAVPEPPAWLLLGFGLIYMATL